MITKRLDKKGVHEHNPSGRYIKSFVYGGLDGIITTFAVVAGVAGASLSASVVLILGFANLAADGISMAFGDYLSTKAEKEYRSSEKKKEEVNLENFPRNIKKELIKIYLTQGFKKIDAEKLSSVVCKNKKACVDVMLAYEIGIAGRKEPLKNAAITFSSFVLFGFIPLIAYVFAKSVSLFGENTFPVAAVFTGLTLFGLGSAKCKITRMNWARSGVEMLLVGGLAALTAYLIGKFISAII